MLVLIGLLAACEPQATPLPAYIAPTETPTPAPVTLQPIRYALMPGTPTDLPDLDAISNGAQITRLDAPPPPEALGLNYDVIAGYGERPGWTLAPVTPHVSLLINASLTPLNDPSVLDTLRNAINTQALISMLAIPGAQADLREPLSLSDLRAAMANAGWPDGFDLTASSVVIPGSESVALQLQRMSLQVDFRESDAETIAADLRANRLNLALVSWIAPEEREQWASLVGEDNIIDLFALPISYVAADGLTISFTPNGWPLAAR